MFTPIKIRNTSKCLQTPWHPSVVYIPEGWNGHKYWMAQTPFPPTHVPPYGDRYELPCIHFSDDGLNFYPIDSNPIVDLTADEIEAHNYYSDPHLVLRDGQLELYFRYTILKDKLYIGNTTLLLRSNSTDGLTWSDPIVIADLRQEKDINIWGEQIISQSLRWDGQGYECWYVDKSSYLSNRNIRLTKSENGVDWCKNVLCTLDGYTIDPWHIDVQHYDDKYQIIVYDLYQLVWYESVDGVHFHFVSQVLVPSSNPNDFYSDGLYRACSIKVNNDILVYFSAKRKDKSFIGCLKTIDRIEFIPISGISTVEWMCLLSRSKIKIYCKNCKKNIKRILSHTNTLCKPN